MTESHDPDASAAAGFDAARKAERDDDQATLAREMATDEQIVASLAEAELNEDEPR